MNGRTTRRRGAAALRAIAAGVLLAALAGCPPRQPFGPEPFDDAWALLEEVKARQSAPEHAVGDARLRVHTERGTFGADHFVALRRPGSLRLETLSFFGNPLALTLVDAGRLLLWDLDAGRAYVGPATADTFGVVAPVGIGPATAVSMLLGTPPLLPTGDLLLELDHERRLYRLVLGSGGISQHLLVHPESLTLQEVVWLEEGRPVARLSYDRYRAAGAGRFPYETRYEAEDGSWVEATWREVDVDTAPERGLFEVELPPGLPVVPLTGARVESPLPPVPADDPAQDDPAGDPGAGE